MQQYSQLSREELVGVQDNNAEIAWELSDFENEVYLSEDDLELDSEEVNMHFLSIAVPDGIETLIEQEKPKAFTMLMTSAYSRGDAVFGTTSFKCPSVSNKQKKPRSCPPSFFSIDLFNLLYYFFHGRICLRQREQKQLKS
jgi:hypothetical protein